MDATTRQLIGVLLRDVPRYLPALLRGGDACMAIRNRDERLEPAPDASGFRCDWRWTSDLHAPKMIPALGRELMRRCLAAHPVRRAAAPADAGAEHPQVSFLIGHRGAERLPHLLATIGSIAGQRDMAVECIVVEQDAVSTVGAYLPSWVSLVHTPPPAADMPYCRSWAFNVAARQARAPVLVLHDNDMLVSSDYAGLVAHRVAQGYDVVNLKRFIFYLTQAHTATVFDGRRGLADAAPAVIVQNLEAGGSVAITRAAFEKIGAMDESFIGWGGEDNEFWERAQTLRSWTWGALPVVHLWHAAQPGKHDSRSETAAHYRALAQLDPRERIERLRCRPQGRRNGPVREPSALPGAAS